MPRARVSASTLKRLDAVSDSLYGTDGGQRRGVMRVPLPMTYEEWEQLAIPHQQGLMVATQREMGGNLG